MIFLLGGARSGKSTLAVEMARRSGHRVSFIATARAEDEEMTDRISHHRKARPQQWRLIEEPVELSRAVAEAPREELVLVDCLTLWLSNLMPQHDDTTILAMVDEAATAAAARRPEAIVISNEVGTGLVPMDPVARRFRDLQGRANQRFATSAGRAYLVVAGMTVPLESPGVD